MKQKKIKQKEMKSNLPIKFYYDSILGLVFFEFNKPLRETDEKYF